MSDLPIWISGGHVTRTFSVNTQYSSQPTRLPLRIAPAGAGSVGAMGVTSQLKARLGEERYRLLQVRPTSHPRRILQLAHLANRRRENRRLNTSAPLCLNAVRQRGVSAGHDAGGRVLRRRADHPRRRRRVPARTGGQAPGRGEKNGAARVSRAANTRGGSSSGSSRSRSSRSSPSRRARGRGGVHRATPGPRREPPPAGAHPSRRLQRIHRILRSVRENRRRTHRRTRRRRRRRRRVFKRCHARTVRRRGRRGLLPRLPRRARHRAVRPVLARAVRRVPRAVAAHERVLLRRR